MQKEFWIKSFLVCVESQRCSLKQQISTMNLKKTSQPSWSCAISYRCRHFKRSSVCLLYDICFQINKDNPAAQMEDILANHNDFYSSCASLAPGHKRTLLTFFKIKESAICLCVENVKAWSKLLFTFWFSWGKLIDFPLFSKLNIDLQIESSHCHHCMNPLLCIDVDIIKMPSHCCHWIIAMIKIVYIQYRPVQKYLQMFFCGLFWSTLCARWVTFTCHVQ